MDQPISPYSAELHLPAWTGPDHRSIQSSIAPPFLYGPSQITGPYSPVLHLPAWISPVFHIVQSFTSLSGSDQSPRPNPAQVTSPYSAVLHLPAWTRPTQTLRVRIAQALRLQHSVNRTLIMHRLADKDGLSS
ncbi:interleukin-1 beta-like [Platysternon megacephalum]|uniref:Interleukin-1 beta-like n=1 Tax=Platysternon megacephalum TaxID=55544 RepID=A0A4D9DR75_9SAUR|nr:interleukin-1 beta-like [Platysternon megacephalum]